MARTKIPVEFSSTPGIVDNSTVTAITIDSAGTATFSGAVTADGLTTNTAKLKAIAKDISDTAVDVFVYDTRKDSDGGAWRKRTQHTSWYNETLNTATRGARKEFPSVAVIVAESDTVTIYDGDDPDMPMWMVFTQATLGNLILGYGTTSSRPVHSIAMLDGTLVVSEQGSSGCLYKISMLADTSQWITENPSYGGFFKGDISTRNDGAGSSNYPSNVAGNPFKTIVSSLCNDVAMTVLPNAPIDADTGLPVPTIAVATAGGVSVIKDDGTIVDIVSDTLVHKTPREVKLVGDKVFWIAGNNYDNAWSSVNSIEMPATDVTIPYLTVTTANDLVSKYTPKDWAVVNHVGDLVIPINTGTPRTDGLIEVTKDNELIIGGKGADDHGTVVKIVENVSDPKSGMLAQIASDFNTGYQVGDIKLAALSDTDTTNAVGTELLTNTDFTSGTSPWVAVQASISAGSNKLTITPNSGVNGGVYHAITTVVGKTYVYQLKVLADASNLARMFAGTGNDINSANKSDLASKFLLGNATHLITFVATGTTTYIWIEVGGGTQQATEFDDATVSLAEVDRSVNNNALQVFGTITKTAVATGAELVGYTPSGTSYLRQPSAGGLTLTSDFSITWWQKYDGSGGTYEGWQIVEDDTSSATNYDKVVLSAMHEISSTQYLIRGASITASGVTNGIASGTWTCMTITKTGGKINLYTNGKLSSTTTGTCATPSNAYSLEILRWKYGNSSYYANDSAIALFRTSNTVPSEEQIAKMYNDEKFLFQENAKATLYGTSDAVTALAYDEDTELLHVGTNAGRSVFQGLNRVDNTTDAVGTAISASNGLVAED